MLCLQNQVILTYHEKLEDRVSETLLPPEQRGIHSLHTSLIGGDALFTAKVVSPLETAANKYSALLWRIHASTDTEQSRLFEESSVIRHLYDLASLSNLIFEKLDLFKSLTIKSFEADRGRGGTDRNSDLLTYVEKVIEQFDSVSKYEKEYNSFVSAMSYAREDERIGYAEAVALFKKISTCFTV